MPYTLFSGYALICAIVFLFSFYSQNQDKLAYILCSKRLSDAHPTFKLHIGLPRRHIDVTALSPLGG